MESVSTTRMSSKGQVVIPENIRKQLNLKTGTQFVVVGDKDRVIVGFRASTQPTYTIYFHQTNLCES